MLRGHPDMLRACCCASGPSGLCHTQISIPSAGKSQAVKGIIDSMLLWFVTAICQPSRPVMHVNNSNVAGVQSSLMLVLLGPHVKGPHSFMLAEP